MTRDREHGEARSCTLGRAWLRAHPARVFLAEDDEAIRTVLAAALRHDGLEVIEAGDGADLTELLESGQLRRGRPLAPDLIVTDIAMPGQSGIEVLRRLRETDPETPVILITAFGSPEVRAEAQRLGVAAFLDKPFGLAELQTAIANLVHPR